MLDARSMTDVAAALGFRKCRNGFRDCANPVDLSGSDGSNGRLCLDCAAAHTVYYAWTELTEPQRDEVLERIYCTPQMRIAWKMERRPE